jgi:hypothetical protein
MDEPTCPLCQRYLHSEAGTGLTLAAYSCAVELGMSAYEVTVALVDVYHRNDHQVPDVDLRRRFDAVVAD